MCTWLPTLENYFGRLWINTYCLRGFALILEQYHISNIFRYIDIFLGFAAAIAFLARFFLKKQQQ